MLQSLGSSRVRRRGVILVVILGMLALMALIGVTFATFSGQARINARNFSQSKNRASSSEMMEFALTQLIYDSANPVSAIRGHSLLRDMYGNDASNNGYLDHDPSSGNLLMFQSVSQVPGPGPTMVKGINVAGLYKCVTNLPLNDASVYGYDFTRWIVKFPGGAGATTYYVSQTHEVLVDDKTGTDAAVRIFYVAPPDTTTVFVGNSTTSQLPGIPMSTQFVLDGRYLRAFNGSGVAGAGYNPAYGNFRVNGYDLDVLAMDEDYDACDLENWFLAIQSADGQVIIPSFHRPGILRADPSSTTYPNDSPSTTVTNDWKNTSPDSAARFLRPRAVDGHNALAFPDLFPDPATGTITYDVDNDGDGITDSVWLDLGYPTTTDAKGMAFKPLFAFLVIGLNGRLPLNTAGNLQLRSLDTRINPAVAVMTPQFQHAAHLGNSPSEIDPTFALQGPPGLWANFPSRQQQDDAGYLVNLTQFRNLLTGTIPQTQPIQIYSTSFPPMTNLNQDADWVPFGMDGSGNQIVYYMPNGLADVGDNTSNDLVFRTGIPVAGRWGEVDFIPGNPNSNPPRPLSGISFNNLIRAGMSISYYNNVSKTFLPYDLDDDNFNTFDPIGGGSPPYPENLDYNDLAGALSVPVERIRRYTTPIDAAGDGWMTAYTSTTPQNGPSGADTYGRVSFFNYFRPPGMPNTAWNSATPGLPMAPTIPDATTNRLHGFESARNPNMYALASLTSALSPQYYAAMPYDMSGGTSVPTFDALINARINSPSPYLNEADEMQLYQGSPYDAPFGPNDLEWLYRKQDSDGQYLQSRLSSLAPISFTNGVDDLRRRRLFALDAWETTNFVWAYDNPGNAFPGNNRFGAGVQPLPASFQALYNGATITSGSQPIQTNGQIIQTPPLAHRDRKIDLNYPLPLSNSPDEPVRQKWIDNAYNFLKYALPPGATDTPQELAQLSQYLINVIDFRDPDATCTRYRNPDLFLRPASPPTPPQPPQPATLMSYATASPPFNKSSDLYLDQYGMEYSPVAINEVLAYSFLRKYKDSTSSTGNSAGYPTNRFFVELVNTLTESAGTGASTSTGPSTYPNANSNPSTLVLNNWEMVVTSDDPINRPDPTTGQLLTLASGAYPASAPTGIYGPIPLASTTFTNNPTTLTSKDVTLVPLTSSGPPSVQVSASGLPIAYYYVIGNPLLGAPTGHNAFENNPPTTPTSTPTAPVMVQTLDPQYDLWDLNNSGATGAKNQKQPGVPVYAPLPTPASGTAKYYWLYLRRPANPFQPASSANPMIVVDCIRFPYIEGGGKPPTTVDPTDDTKDSRLIPPFPNCNYSAQRVTPYQGGHAVALASATANSGQNDTTYGYSEQMATPTTTTGNTSGYFGNQPITNPIQHTLGAPNDPSGGQNWDYIPFHDRDFTSVAELMLVPGCPPGLFTKQFAEDVPSATFNSNTTYNFSPATGTGATGPALGGNNLLSPHTFPYLVDKFFYTAAASQNAILNPQAVGSPGPTWPVVNGPDSAGWYRMFEFFEVPSPAFGAIGEVASGSNFDWARQDTKPGLLNLNLIIDEEVFLGLMGNAGQAYNLAVSNPLSKVPANLNANQLTAPLSIPHVVTMINPATGIPAQLSASQYAAYPIPNQGFFAPDPNNGNTPDSRLKAAFADFLKLRHGGSGYLFAWGSGEVGQPTASSQMQIASERPFRSLSFPDINYTVMRPATLPPSKNSSTPPFTPITSASKPADAFGSFVWDPGVKNPYLTDQTVTPLQPPPIPPHRLFQIPDAGGNASLVGDSFVNTPTTSLALSTTIFNPTNPQANLAGLDSGTLITLADNRQHPAFRSEWIQKITNLTTVRTHQYTVWITIGLFEVVQPGDPTTATPDILGLEVGLLSGRNTRYRSFFLLDRTRAIGFNPQAPGDLRNVVVYRQDIE